MIANTGRSITTVEQYIKDGKRFINWMYKKGRESDPDGVNVEDARDYRKDLLDQGRAPATINRAMVSLALFFDFAGRQRGNPFRKIGRIEVVDKPPKALTQTEWNAVRRQAEKLVSRDHGLALAIICLIRYAGPRVGEVAALKIPDVQLSPRRGRLVIRRGKGLKHREVPLVVEAREPLHEYLLYRRQLSDRWKQRARFRGQEPPKWAAWPDGHLFLGQRGPLSERGIRDIFTKIGEMAKLEEPLAPHHLRHTFAKALLDPASYGFNRPSAPITAVQELLGHADISTTAIYTRASQADMARIMGDDVE